MGFTFEQCSGVHPGGSFAFSNPNTAGNLLVLAFEGYNFSPIPTPPASITDSAGNIYQKAYFGSINVLGYASWAAFYYCASCLESSNNTITTPSVFGGGGATFATALEYSGSTPAATFDGAGGIAESDTTANPSVSISCNTGELVVGFGFVHGGNATAGAGMTQRSSDTVAIEDAQATGTNFSVGIINASSVDGSMVAGIAFKTGGAGQSAGGGSNIQLITGPKYIFECLPEGRKIARVNINCNSYEIIQGVFNFSELSDAISSTSIVGYVMQEFDLSYLQANIGMSQVRSLIAYSRPLFLGDDFGGNVGSALPSLITDEISGQSVILGAQAIALGKSGAIEHLVTPFIGDCTSGNHKVRFLSPQLALTPIGRFTLLFCNFDVKGAFIQAGSF